MRKFFATLLVAILFFVASSSLKSARASEGTVELKNIQNTTARCFAASILMQDLSYNIIVSCRDIIYPGGTNVFTYVMWANPIDGGSPFKLGTLNFGKVAFRTQIPFSGLFVTKEDTGNVGKPNGPVIMQGSLQGISFLDTVPTPNPNQPTVTPSPTPAPRKSFISKTALSGFVLIISIVIVVVMVFLVKPFS